MSQLLLMLFYINFSRYENKKKKKLSYKDYLSDFKANINHFLMDFEIINNDVNYVKKIKNY